MFVRDNNLRMRFQRQPRVLGTRCYYVPTNKLLHTEGLVSGEQVRIVSYPQNRNDLFVGVVADDNFPGYEIWGKTTVSAEWMARQSIPEDQIKSVLWKDLAQ